LPPALSHFTAKMDLNKFAVQVLKDTLDSMTPNDRVPYFNVLHLNTPEEYIYLREWILTNVFQPGEDLIYPGFKHAIMNSINYEYVLGDFKQMYRLLVDAI